MLVRRLAGLSAWCYCLQQPVPWRQQIDPNHASNMTPQHRATRSAHCRGLTFYWCTPHIHSPTQNMMKDEQGFMCYSHTMTIKDANPDDSPKLSLLWSGRRKQTQQGSTERLGKRFFSMSCMCFFKILKGEIWLLLIRVIALKWRSSAYKWDL